MKPIAKSYLATVALSCASAVGLRFRVACWALILAKGT